MWVEEGGRRARSPSSPSCPSSDLRTRQNKREEGEGRGGKNGSEGKGEKRRWLEEWGGDTSRPPTPLPSPNSGLQREPLTRRGEEEDPQAGRGRSGPNPFAPEASRGWRSTCASERQARQGGFSPPAAWRSFPGAARWAGRWRQAGEARRGREGSRSRVLLRPDLRSGSFTCAALYSCPTPSPSPAAGGKNAARALPRPVFPGLPLQRQRQARR